MSELKPCPFCGGKAELVCTPGYFKTGLSSSGWLIKCLNGCCNQMPYGSDHDAIEAWNRRAGDAPTIEPERKKGEWEIYVISPFDGEDCRCSECGKCGCAPYWNYCPNCGSDMRGNQNENN